VGVVSDLSEAIFLFLGLEPARKWPCSELEGLLIEE
jgi:hypothetical protein